MPQEKEELKRLVAHLREQIDHLHQIATRDEKTGLYNSMFFKSVFEFELRKAARDGKFSVVIADLDFFKKVNDTYGHITADGILKRTAEVLQRGMRSIDVLSRFGGEEFFMILSETDIGAAQSIAERLRHSIMNDRQLKKYKITASFGLAEYKKGDNFEKLSDRADRALYKAKELGRNKVCYLKTKKIACVL